MGPAKAAHEGYRYLGPAEPPDSSLNPYDPNSQMALVHRADYVRDIERLADLETINAGLRDQLAFKTDRLASVEAHNVELVAKYEALLRSLPRSAAPRETSAFPTNALGHAPRPIR